MSLASRALGSSAARATVLSVPLQPIGNWRSGGTLAPGGGVMAKVT
ncbi:hypothetical protein LJR039_004902 [Pseudorhodoferax sp. LjRoot39]